MALGISFSTKLGSVDCIGWVGGRGIGTKAQPWRSAPCPTPSSARKLESDTRGERHPNGCHISNRKTERPWRFRKKERQTLPSNYGFPAENWFTLFSSKDRRRPSSPPPPSSQHLLVRRTRCCSPASSQHAHSKGRVAWGTVHLWRINMQGSSVLQLPMVN